jgi:hypothetical protein
MQGVSIFGLVMIVLFAGFVAAIVLLGLYSPRSGADVLGWRPRDRDAAAEEQDEVDDIAQMLDASNALRRARGAPERTEDDVAADVQATERELDRRARELRSPSPPTG